MTAAADLPARDRRRRPPAPTSTSAWRPGRPASSIFEQELGTVIAGPNAAGRAHPRRGHRLRRHRHAGAGRADRDLAGQRRRHATTIPADRQAERGRSTGFRGWGRACTDFETGVYGFDTVKPGRGRRAATAAPMAPHLNLWIVARGINIGLNTRIYFADEAEANAKDPVLSLIEQDERRADADRPARGARRRGRLPLRHPPAGRGRDGVLRYLRHACRALHHLRRDHRLAAAEGEQPGGADHRRRAGRDRRRRPSRPAPRSPTAHVRNDDETPDLRPGAVRAAARGPAPALPGHDRPVLDRRPLRRRPRARRHAGAQARHGLARRRARTTSRPGSTRTRPTWSTGWPPRCWPTASSPRSRPSTSATSSRRSRWRRTGRIEGAALRPVRHGREERDAGRPRRSSTSTSRP